MAYISLFLGNESGARSWIVRVLWGAQKFKMIVVESGQDLWTREMSDLKRALGPLNLKIIKTHSINMLFCTVFSSSIQLLGWQQREREYLVSFRVGIFQNGFNE